MLGTPGLLPAQSRATSADLAGTILDESKAVLPGVSLVVTHLDTGIERLSTSDGEGRFSVPALSPGPYRLRAELQGFAPSVVERLELTLGGSTSITITMMVGRLNEGVVVRAESPIVELERAVLATTVSQQQIEGLPINGRNFISFSLIAPGVMSDRIPVQGATATTGLSFAGQRARSNNITVDGLDNNDSMVGSVRATFSQEAVQEFQVLAQGYTAEFGKASGGVVNIVTKSGGNVPDRQRIRLRPRRCPEREGVLRAIHAERRSRSISPSRRLGSSSGAACLAGRSERTGPSTLVRSSDSTSPPATS